MRIHSLIPAILSVALGVGGAWAAADPVTLEIEMHAPASPDGGVLWCGVVCAGQELASVSSRYAEAGAWRGGATTRVVMEPSVAERLSEGACRVHATLNGLGDPYQASYPSYGDLYQRATLVKVDRGWRAVLAETGWQRKTLTAAKNLLTVHYHRTDDDYGGVSLWTWDEHLKRAPESNELQVVGTVSFGRVFQIDLGLYGSPGDGIGMVPRRNADWQQKDGGDRMWRPALGRSVYLIQDENELYSEEPDVSPKVRRVALDADHNLTLRFSHRLPTADWTPDKFKLETSTGEQLTIKGVFPFRHRGDLCALYSIEVVERLEYPQQAYALTVEGFGTHNVQVGHIVKDPARFYDGEAKLGAHYTPAATTFGVFAPGAMAVDVVVADVLEGDAGLVRHLMHGADTGVWTATVAGDLAGKYYAYAVRGIGFDPEEEITDIYATCTQGRRPRSLIVDLDGTDPPGFRDASVALPASPADAIIYELHVRDFTISADSGVSAKGKYAGLTEGGTKLVGSDGVATGLDHLVEMGVTHVQIMPVQDFDNAETPDDSYNWGYMPVHFNSPEGWYASDAKGPAKIGEFKQVVQALHARGIGVIMDVVYNHTAGWAPFERLVPGYYHRLTDAGNFSNGSGCGNEFASEHPMARKFMLDSVKFWVEEYGVDGFRFDLMGLTDLETMKQIKAELSAMKPGILVYGEPWTGGHTPLKPVTDKHQVKGTGIGSFNDGFRDAVKGDRDGGAPGFIQTGDRSGDVVKGLMGAIHDWAIDPTDTLNYCEAHDNLTTWDKLMQSVPHGDDALHKRMLRFSALTVLTAQGTIFIHSGQEMGRSKKGSHNSYNLPDEYNRIEWSLKKRNAAEVAYMRGLIALRKAHPAFRLRTRAEVEKRVAFMTPPDHRCIEYHIDAAGVEGESVQAIRVLLNGAPHDVTFPLHSGTWGIYVDADRAGTEALGQAGGSIVVPAHSGVVVMH